MCLFGCCTFLKKLFFATNLIVAACDWIVVAIAMDILNLDSEVAFILCTVLSISLKSNLKKIHPEIVISV